MRDDHVAKRAGRFVEAGALAEAQRLRHVDLHVIDEVAIPDRLEQAVGEPERENVLRRLLAEEVVDAKDLLLGEHLVQLRVQRHRTREIGAERLLHDDARALARARPRRACARPTARRSAARSGSADGGISLPMALLRALRRRLAAPRRRPTAARSRETARTLPSRSRSTLRAENSSSAPRANSRKAVGVEIVERHADDAAAGNEARARQVKQPRQQLAPREVARRAEQHHDLRKPRTDPRRNLRHGALPFLLVENTPRDEGFTTGVPGRGCRGWRRSRRNSARMHHRQPRQPLPGTTHPPTVTSAPLYSTVASAAASRSAGALPPALIQRTLNVRSSGMPV